MKKRHWRVLLPLMIGALALTLPHCGKLPTATAPASGTFGSVYASIQSANCVQCHDPAVSASAAHGSTLNFTTQALAYSTLTGNTVTASASVGICGGIKIVFPTDPAKSYLAAVLFADYNTNNFAGQGGCQPYNVHLSDQHISATEKTSFIDWITAGALNN